VGFDGFFDDMHGRRQLFDDELNPNAKFASTSTPAVGPLYKLVNPVDPTAWKRLVSQPLNLKCDLLVSKVCFFKCNLCAATLRWLGWRRT
jgi:hypothetical protein